MKKEIEDKILKILEEEIVVSEGCTEPNALAYASALGTRYLEEKPLKIEALISGNIIKNVKGVIMPSSGGMKGIECALALGVFAGNPDESLMVIAKINDKQRKEAQDFCDNKNITYKRANTDIKLFINLVLTGKNNKVEIELQNLHTNITKLIVNDKNITPDDCDSNFQFNTELSYREILTINLIHETANKLDINKVRPIFKEIIDKNMSIAKEGIKGDYGVGVGKYTLLDSKESGIVPIQVSMSSYAAAGSDARMNGCALPVMTCSGSGNQGMTCSIPIIDYCVNKNIEEEKMLRGLIFSVLATIHIKTNIGRLSPFCGVVCASAAVAGAIAYIETNNYDIISGSITNLLGNIAGIACDGAKSSCALKINSSVLSAYNAFVLAKNNKVLPSHDGIVGDCIEKTIINIGKLSTDGMSTTDETILDIMTSE